MAPQVSALYTASFIFASLITLVVCASLRLLAILPRGPSQPGSLRRRPVATRLVIVLGSGGHTHEMFHLLRDLDTRKYTHRTYMVSSGDAFSAGRAAEFERELEQKEKQRRKEEEIDELYAQAMAGGKEDKSGGSEERQSQTCTGPDSFNITTLPRARKIHQPLLTTPISSLYTLLSTFAPLLSSPPLLPNQPPQTPYEAAAQDLPDLIISNGPGTGVIVILASLILRFFNWRGANSRGKCKTVYVESFARVNTLSLSAKLVGRVVDRFLVQWEELEGRLGGRAEYWGILV